MIACGLPKRCGEVEGEMAPSGQLGHKFSMECKNLCVCARPRTDNSPFCLLQVAMSTRTNTVGERNDGKVREIKSHDGTCLGMWWGERVCDDGIVTL